MTLTKEELASKLNNNQYLNEISKELELQAKENGLVVVFGASDDLIELRGSIHDEYGAGSIYFHKKNLVEFDNRFDNLKDQIEFLKSYGLKFNDIKSVWDDKEINASWSYKTDIPHSTFDIYEDDELYCRGIVFSLDDLKGFGCS